MTTTDTTHNFTLDELQAYDEGVLAPERAAVVGRHLAAVALTVATLRFVVARPAWPARPASTPTAHWADATGHGDRGAERGRR